MNDWKRMALGDAFQTVTGGTPPKSNASFYGDYLPFVKPPELCDCEVVAAEDGLSKEGAALARIAPVDSILVSCIGNLGKIGWNRVQVAFNQQINAIVADKSKALPGFMFYQVRSARFRAQLETHASGTTVPIVNKSKFNSIEIVLPPLPEQQRIVGILDKAFAAIATAKANAEKNLHNARELFVSHLWSVFDHLKAPMRKVGEFGTVFDGPHATPKTVSAGPIFLGISTLKDGRLLMGETRHVTPLDYKKWTRRVVPREGDVVFSYETQLGQAALIPKGLDCCLGRRMALVRVDTKKVEPRYFVYYYVSPQFRHFLSAHAIRGATVDRISLREFPGYHVPLPALSEQRRVADFLDDSRQRIDRLEALYEQKLAALDALKKSLLHQAFTGQL